MSVNFQCFLDLHATCFRFRPPVQVLKGFSTVHETSVIIVEDLFTKRLFKT
jgi:hypothetical protein